MKNLILNLDGERIQIWAQVIGNELWAHFDGQTFVQDLQTSSRRKSRSGGAVAENELVAPMPGKILSIKTSKGQEVKKGDVLIVMEAMKMEYSLSAPKDGKVEDVLCQESDQVLLKQKLVTLNFEG